MGVGNVSLQFFNHFQASSRVRNVLQMCLGLAQQGTDVLPSTHCCSSVDGHTEACSRLLLLPLRRMAVTTGIFWDQHGVVLHSSCPGMHPLLAKLGLCGLVLSCSAG